MYELPRKNVLKRRSFPSGIPSIPSVLLLAIIIAALYFAREICIPLAFALALTLLLTRPTMSLQRRHIPRAAAVAIVMLCVIAGAAGVGWVIANQLVDVANELPKYRENIHRKIVALRSPAKGALARAAESVKELGRELSPPPAPVVQRAEVQSPRNAMQSGAPLPVHIVEAPANGLKYVREIVEPFLSPLAKILMVLVFTAFLLMKREDVRNRLLRLAGLSQLNIMTQALDDATQRISRYLLMQFIVNATFGALFAIGLALIGTPYAALWGVVVALFRLVPYVGTAVALLLPLTLSLAVFDGWARPSMVFGLFASLELTIANVLEPWLYGAHTGISSFAILVSAVFWTLLWGPAGLILSTPLTVCVAVLGRYVPQLSFLHVLLGDEPVLQAEAHLYQRLLAMDQSESRAIVDQFLKDHSQVELYDSLLVPALILAEQDRHKGALDPAREEFLYLSVNEIVAESVPDPGQKGDREGAGFPGRVMVVPASDPADEVTGAMLAQVLERLGFAVVSLPAGPVREVLRALDPGEGDVVCVSALPPFATQTARNLCRRIRTRFPRVHLVAGIWGLTGSVEDAMNRFEGFQPDKLTGSIGETVSYLESLAGRKVVEADEPESRFTPVS